MLASQRDCRNIAITFPGITAQNHSRDDLYVCPNRIDTIFIDYFQNYNFQITKRKLFLTVRPTNASDVLKEVSSYIPFKSIGIWAFLAFI